MQNYYNTQTAFEKLGHIEDVEELRQELLPKLRDQRTIWAEQIGQMVRSSGRSYKEFAELCGITEAALRKWRKGSLPQNRDAYIRIGFAAGYDSEQMNAFLQRYGRCPGLYVKSLEDCACMYVLESKTLPHDYDTYQELLSRMKTVLSQSEDVAQVASTTRNMLENFRQVDSDDALMDFVQTHAASYKAAYLRLYSYILQFLKANRMDDRLDGKGKLRTIQSLSESQEWSSSLRHCISAIRSKRWYPTRSKIISLGLHLNMDLEEMNQMLRLAQMETLYAGNPAEAALIFALESAELEEMICCDGEAELRDYVRDVLAGVELAEAEFLLERL